MDRLETRELAYFVAVAEELHFGRAADRLGIAQPPLSRAIRQLEHRLGVGLLNRTSRRITLTPAGEVLLREARRVLDAVSSAAQLTQRAGRVDPRLVVVMKPGGDGGLMPEILARYEAEPDAVPVEMLICGIGEQEGLLRAGNADVGFLHRPYDTDPVGFDSVDLLVERPVVVLPKGHRLADRTSVCQADLVGEPHPAWPGQGPDGDCGDFRDGSQLMQLIALGRAVAVLPESVRYNLRQDLTSVPVTDAEPTTLVLAWPEANRSRSLAAFVRTATTVAETAAYELR
jgi:DNA-binding transcriptional LysR family regulator